MKSSPELFELIQAMTPSEKRFFRLQATRHEKKAGNHYLELFDAINRQDDYDERVLRDTSDKKHKHRFATEKNYLHNLLLDTLNFYHRSRPSIAIFNQLTMIDVLHGKKMFAACLRIARKGKQETLRQERFFPALSFIRWEATILTLSGKQADALPVIAQEQDIVAKLALQTSMMHGVIQMRVWLDTGKMPLRQAEAEVLRMHRAFRAGEKAGRITFLTLYYYYSASALYAGYKNKQELRKKNYMYVHQWLEEHPWILRDVPHIYHNNMNNIVNAFITMKQYNAALVWIRKQRGFMAEYGLKNDAMSARIFLNTYENEIFIYALQEKYSEGIALVKAIDTGIRKFGRQYEGEQYDLFMALAIFLYGGNDRRGAARWLNRILTVKSDIRARAEIIITAQLLLYIILAEQRDYSFTAYGRSLERKLNQSDTFRSGLLVFQFVRLHADKRRTNEKQLQHLFRKFRNAVKTEQERGIIKHFDFSAWMGKQLAAKPRG